MIYAFQASPLHLKPYISEDSVSDIPTTTTVSEPLPTTFPKPITLIFNENCLKGKFQSLSQTKSVFNLTIFLFVSIH